MEEKLQDCVRVNVGSDGEVTAQITFTADELFHLLWRGDEWYDAQDAQRHVDLESSIAHKLGFASDVASDIISTQEFKSDKRNLFHVVKGGALPF